MNCEQSRLLIHGDVDGELDPATSLALKQHTDSCAACTQVYESQRQMRTVLADANLRYQAPAQLSKRIRSSLRTADTAGTGTMRIEPRAGASRWRLFGPLMAAVAALEFVALIGLGLGHPLPISPNESASVSVPAEVQASHVRSLMLNHLTDVVSSDQHTVKPWFAGKLDFSPTVVDLASLGYPLVGGRLDYLDNRPVAALVYQRRLHYINLFVWPAPGADIPVGEPQTTTLQGYHIVHWQTAGMTHWAVSDLASDELLAFARLLQQP